MAIKVRLTWVLARHADGQKELQIDAVSVRDLIDKLRDAHPELASRLCDENGELRRTLNFFVNQENIRTVSGDDTELRDGDEISIVPLIAGG